MHGLTARQLRYVLLAGLLVLLCAATVVFAFGYSKLTAYNAETSELSAAANAGDTNLATLRRLKAYLESHEYEIQRAADIVSSNLKYQYQNDTVNDIMSFASQSGITIAMYDFEVGGAAASKSTTPTSSAPAAKAPGTIAGVSPTTITITVKSPTNYAALYKFIQLIEQNPKKMQIARISLTADEKNAGAVITDSFSIEVYIRNDSKK